MVSPVLLPKAHRFVLGKSTWLFYVLIRLICKGQVVALRTRHGLFVFYEDGHVYETTATDATPPTSDFIDLWTLIHADASGGPPKQSITYEGCFPVLASSPNPSRYSLLMKQRVICTIGMPLWDLTELESAYVIMHVSIWNAAHWRCNPSLSLHISLTPELAKEPDVRRHARLAQCIWIHGRIAREVLRDYGEEEATMADMRKTIKKLLRTPGVIHDFPDGTGVPDHYSHSLMPFNPIHPRPMLSAPNSRALSSLGSYGKSKGFWSAHKFSKH